MDRCFFRLLAEADAAATWLDYLPAPIREYVPADPRVALFLLVCILVALLIVSKVLGGIRRFLRRRRPPTIHPNLQKYNIDHAQLSRERQEKARTIVATSTGNRLAGFRIVRQVEAVFVEGYRTPEDAIIALKAAAADRGANAILNVQTQRTAAGRCSASGDAIVAATMLAPPSRPPARSSPPPAGRDVPLPPPSPRLDEPGEPRG